MFIPLRRLVPDTAGLLELIPLTGADQLDAIATREMGRCFAPP